jgi:hypothetical protein
MNPQDLINDLNKIADKYGKVSERLCLLKKLYSEYYKTFRPDYKSDAGLDRGWDLTIEGQEMEEANMKLKVYDRKMSAIKTNLRHLQTETYNQY